VSTVTLLIIVLAVVVVGALILVIVGLRSPQDADPLQARLAEFASRGEAATLEEIELSQPLSERIIYPIARKLGELALRFTPQNAIQQMARKLERAGNPGNIDPTMFFAFRFLGLGLGVVFLVLDGMVSSGFLNNKGLWFGIPASVLGFYLPDLLLKSRIDRRSKSVRKAGCTRLAYDLC
jgi:tight adherence protein C